MKNKQYHQDRYAKMRRAKERRRLEGESPDYPKPLKDFRRGVIVADFDFDDRILVVSCNKSDRKDCYSEKIGTITDIDLIKIIKYLFSLVENYTLINERIGWSKILEDVRKRFFRIGPL